MRFVCLLISTPVYMYMYKIMFSLFITLYTVEPPIVDPPTKGHNIIDLSTKDTGQGPKNLFP